MNVENIMIFRDILRKIDQVKSSNFKEDTECCGITVSQCHTLLEIGNRGELSIVDLADTLGLDTSTLSRTINGMVNIGLVDRLINPADRRYVNISLTKQGQTMYEMINQIYNNFYLKIFENIPEDKHRQVMESFSLFLEGFRKFKGTYCCNTIQKEWSDIDG